LYQKEDKIIENKNLVLADLRLVPNFIAFIRTIVNLIKKMFLYDNIRVQL